MLSVNTNQGAMVALQTLNKTNSDLDKTQNAISTGLKVASAKDNGAIWAIANKMRSDVGAYDRVRESADRAASILDTGIAAGESIMELLNEIRVRLWPVPRLVTQLRLRLLWPLTSRNCATKSPV